MSNPYTFGSRLKQLRQEHGLTQDALAERVGCATQTIRKIEGGQRRPSYQVAARLAEELSIAPGERARFIRSARDEPTNGPTDLPPTAAPETQHVSPPHAQCSLPTPLTRLIGREQEITHARQLLLREDLRLLTLLGPGGAGKTRLGLEVAAQLAVEDAEVHAVVGQCDIALDEIAGGLVLSRDNYTLERASRSLALCGQDGEAAANHGATTR